MSTSHLCRVLVSVFAVAWVGCSDDTATGGRSAGGSGGQGTAGNQAGGAGGSGGQGFGGGGGVGGQGGTTPGCPGGQELCNGECIPTVVDPNNCGGCGLTCAPNQVCLSNGCADACPSPLSPCQGTCVDLAADAANCGMCGMPCDAGFGCVGGACVPAVPVGPAPAECADGGPIIELEGGPSPLCVGDAADAFGYGLCSCNDIGVPELSSSFFMDAFDSSVDPYVPFGLGGSCGANGSVSMTSDFTVYGDLRSSAGAGLDVGGITQVHQQLQVGHALQLQNSLDVDLDAYIGGPISGSSPATIGGTLFTPSCAAVPGNVDAGACVDGAVSVAPPCDCTNLLPLAAIVAHYADPANNDNAAIGLDPGALDNQGAQALLLPCGIYYLDQIATNGATTIAVDGHTAIIVGGSIEVGSALTFTLTPTSTLDVVVGGTVVASASYVVGTPAYPSKSRFYVAGTCRASGQGCSLDADCCSLQCGSNNTCEGQGESPPFSVRLTSNTWLNGGFYAPFGSFVSTSNLEMYGAIFAGFYDAESSTDIHYDRAFIHEGVDCPPPPGGCGDCSDCGGQACIDGSCGECTNDGQCCPPLYCVNGECVHIAPQ